MNGADRLAQIRDILNAPSAQEGDALGGHGYQKEIGSYACFKGTQEHRFSLVGPDSPTHILWQTFDRKDGVWTLSRWVLLPLVSFLDLMEALLQAEVREADLGSAPPSSWPEFPILVSEVPAPDGGAVKVLISAWRGYLEIQVSRSLPENHSKRSGQWCKFSGFDSREILRMLMAAFDEANNTAIAKPDSSTGDGFDEIGF